MPIRVERAVKNVMVRTQTHTRTNTHCTAFVQSWQARTVADTALRLAGKSLWPWVREDERKRLLSDALPLVGALGRSAGGGAGGLEPRGDFVPSVPPEGALSEVGENLCASWMAHVTPPPPPRGCASPLYLTYAYPTPVLRHKLALCICRYYK